MSTHIGSRYRCRVHTDEPVSWRGTGCALCELPGGLNRAERRRRLREAGLLEEQADTYEGNQE